MATPNALTMLKADHQKVRDLLTRLTETTTRASKTRRDLLERIVREVHVHAALEEEIFYPALRDAGGDEELKMYFEALEEHRVVADMLIPHLQRTDPGSEQFSGRAKVLKELIEHHADEEEKEMFKAARKVLDAAALRELGERMAERKKELEKAELAAR